MASKEEVTEALNKSVKEMTDKDIKIILEVPETFWPTNAYEHTPKGLLEEQQRRINAKKLTYTEVVEDVVFLSTLRHLVSMGPRIFKEIDLLGLDSLTEEIRRLEPIVVKKVKQYKTENGLN
jgi:hypothetical protein